jgi:hypothetical protein
VGGKFGCEWKEGDIVGGGSGFMISRNACSEGQPVHDVNGRQLKVPLEDVIRYDITVWQLNSTPNITGAAGLLLLMPTDRMNRSTEYRGPNRAGNGSDHPNFNVRPNAEADSHGPDQDLQHGTSTTLLWKREACQPLNEHHGIGNMAYEKLRWRDLEAIVTFVDTRSSSLQSLADPIDVLRVCSRRM